MEYTTLQDLFILRGGMTYIGEMQRVMIGLGLEPCLGKTDRLFERRRKDPVALAKSSSNDRISSCWMSPPTIWT